MARCQTCGGKGWVVRTSVRSGDKPAVIPCPDHCIGGIASCCDTAGAAQPEPPTAERAEGDG